MFEKMFETDIQHVLYEQLARAGQILILYKYLQTQKILHTIMAIFANFVVCSCKAIYSKYTN